MKHTKSSEESMLQFLFRLTWSTIAGLFFVIPSFILLYIANDILRFMVNVRLRLKYGPKTHVLEEGSDAVWLYKVKNGKRQILYLAINDDPIDIERHRQNYVEKILDKPEYQKLKQTFIVDFSYNVQKFDNNFDIRNHVKYYEDSETRIMTEQELMDHVLPALSEEMDESKPQWEDVIIPKFKYDKDDEKVRSARIFRIHHAYMDGGSNLLMIAATQYEGEGEFPYVVHPMAPPKVALWKRALYKFNCLLLFGWVIIHGIYAPSSKVVRNRFRTPVLSGQTSYAWSKPIPMKLLKQIKDTSGKSMPTILMTILGGAIRKLNVKYPCKNIEFLEDPKQNDEITVGMVAGIFPYPDMKLKNRHSIFHMKIDVSDKTPLDRLESTNETMNKVMWDPHVYLNLFIPGLFGRTPIWFSDACMRVMGFPLVLSNIPVAQKRVRLWGNDVLEIGGWPPMLTHCGMGLVTIRYGDNLRVCVNTDKASISKEELDYFISQVAEEVNKLAFEVSTAPPKITEVVGLTEESYTTEPISLENGIYSSPTPSIHKTFEETFFQNLEGSALRFRLNNSFNTIKDSLSKFREP